MVGRAQKGVWKGLVEVKEWELIGDTSHLRQTKGSVPPVGLIKVQANSG